MEETGGKVTNIQVSTGEKKDGSKWKRATIEIDGKKYSTFDNDIIENIKVDNHVTITYDTSGDKDQFRNIKTLFKLPSDQKVFTKASEYKPEGNDREKKIIRQSCLKCATELIGVLNQIDPVKAKELTNERIVDLTLEVAGTLETWVNR